MITPSHKKSDVSASLPTQFKHRSMAQAVPDEKQDFSPALAKAVSDEKQDFSPALAQALRYNWANPWPNNIREERERSLLRYLMNFEFTTTMDTMVAQLSVPYTSFVWADQLRLQVAQDPVPWLLQIVERGWLVLDVPFETQLVERDYQRVVAT